MASNAPQGFSPQFPRSGSRIIKTDIKPKTMDGIEDTVAQFRSPFDDTPFISQPVSSYRTDATINYERLKDRNKRLRSLMDLDPRTTEAMLLNIAGAWEAGQIQKQFNEIRGTAIKKAEAEAEKKKKEAVKKDFKERIKTRWPDKDDQAEISKYPARFNKLVKDGDWDGFQEATDKDLDKPRRNKKNRAWMDRTYDKDFLQWFEQQGGNLDDLAKFKIKDGQDTKGNVVNGIRSIINEEKKKYDSIPRPIGAKERTQLIQEWMAAKTDLKEALRDKVIFPLKKDGTRDPEHQRKLDVINKQLDQTWAIIQSGEEAVVVNEIRSNIDGIKKEIEVEKGTTSDAVTERKKTALDPFGRGVQRSEVEINEGQVQKDFFDPNVNKPLPSQSQKLPPELRQKIENADKANPLTSGVQSDNLDMPGSGVTGSYEAPLSPEERKKRRAIVTSDSTEKQHQDRLKKEGIFDEVYGGDEEVDSDDWGTEGLGGFGGLDDLFGIEGAIKLGTELSPKVKKKLQQAGDEFLKLAEKVSPDIDYPEEEKLELGKWTGKHTKEGRKIYRNNKGGESSEYTIGVKHQQINGGELTHIPSIYGGKIVDQATAEQNIIDNGGKDPETGRYIGPGGDPEARSRSIGEQDKLSTRFVPTAKERMMDLVMPKGERSIHLEESVDAEYGSDGSVGKGIVKAAEEGDPKAKAFLKKLERDFNIDPPPRLPYEKSPTGLKTYPKEDTGYFEGIGKVFNAIKSEYKKWRKGDEQSQKSIASGQSDVDTDNGGKPASPDQIKASFESSYKQGKTQFKKGAVWANILTENPPLDPNAIGYRLEEDPKTGKMIKKTTREFPNGIPVSYGLAQVRMGAVKDVVKANPNSTIAGVFKGKKDREIKELLFDPTVNMTVSVMYHELLRKRFRNNKHTKGFSQKDFEDLVIASYNAGPTKMTDIIKKAMSNRTSISMKSLYVYLPRETKLHVDKFRINRTK